LYFVCIVGVSERFHRFGVFTRFILKHFPAIHFSAPTNDTYFHILQYATKKRHCRPPTASRSRRGTCGISLNVYYIYILYIFKYIQRDSQTMLTPSPTLFNHALVRILIFGIFVKVRIIKTHILKYLAFLAICCCSETISFFKISMYVHLT